METLYRKYRPQKFSDLIGQDHIRKVLEGELATGRIAHAYIFSGPRGVGKTTVARIFARALNCENRKDGASEPCQTCDACKDILQGSAMDVIEIDAASNTGVDHVREHIIENSRFAPTRLKYKIFIIDEVHMLSGSAFNALLKTLEEPPAHVVFMMATTELHKVPDTIISRCQRFAFLRIELPAIVNLLKTVVQAEKIKVAPAVLESIARASDGCPRDAESLLGQILALDDKEITEAQASLVLPQTYRSRVREFITYISARKSKESVKYIHTLVNDGVQLSAFVKETVVVLREILLAKLEHGAQAVPEDFGEAEREIIAKFEITRLMKAVENMNQARRDLDRADIAQLPLELAALDLCFDEVKEKQPQVLPQV